MSRPTVELTEWEETQDHCLKGKMDGRRIITSMILDKETYQEQDDKLRWCYVYYTLDSIYKCYLDTKKVHQN